MTCPAFRKKLIEIGQSIINNGFNGKVKSFLTASGFLSTAMIFGWDFLQELFGCSASEMTASDDEVGGTLIGSESHPLQYP
jgi:hypothetical protein